MGPFENTSFSLRCESGFLLGAVGDASGMGLPVISPDKLSAGVSHHLAYTASPAAGIQALYVDGLQVKSIRRLPKAQATTTTHSSSVAAAKAVRSRFSCKATDVGAKPLPSNSTWNPCAYNGGIRLHAHDLCGPLTVGAWERGPVDRGAEQLRTVQGGHSYPFGDFQVVADQDSDPAELCGNHRRRGAP